MLGRDKKDQIDEAHGNAAIGHHRAPLDGPKKKNNNNGEIISSAHMRLQVKITGHRGKAQTRVVD